VKGEPADISTITEYEWYEWVKSHDTYAIFTVSKVQLGRGLGADVDSVPAAARKIMKANGEVVYRTSVRSLTPDIQGRRNLDHQ
jgi:hypothetical protein